jgi:hypothetical protein
MVVSTNACLFLQRGRCDELQVAASGSPGCLRLERHDSLALDRGTASDINTNGMETIVANGSEAGDPGRVGELSQQIQGIWAHITSASLEIAP